MKILLSLFLIGSLFAQVDEGQGTWIDSPESDVAKYRLYGDTASTGMADPTTLRDSVIGKGVEIIDYQFPFSGRWITGITAVDDSSNESAMGDTDSTTIWQTIDSTATLTPADFTDLTDVALSSYSISNGIALSAFDSAYAYAAGDSFKVGNVGALGVDYVRVFPNDTVFVSCVASGTNSTAEVKTLTIGGVDITYSVTTVAGATYITDSLFLYYDSDVALTDSSWLDAINSANISQSIAGNKGTISSGFLTDGNDWLRGATPNTGAFADLTLELVVNIMGGADTLQYGVFASVKNGIQIAIGCGPSGGNGYISAYVRDDGGYFYDSPIYLVIGWHHLVATYDTTGNVIKLYIDSVAYTHSARGIDFQTDANLRTQIFNDDYDAWQPPSGTIIALMRLYRGIAFTPSQVKTNFESSSVQGKLP